MQAITKKDREQDKQKALGALRKAQSKVKILAKSSAGTLYAESVDGMQRLPNYEVHRTTTSEDYQEYHKRDVDHYTFRSNFIDDYFKEQFDKYGCVSVPFGPGTLRVFRNINSIGAVIACIEKHSTASTTSKPTKKKQHAVKASIKPATKVRKAPTVVVTQALAERACRIVCGKDEMRKNLHNPMMNGTHVMGTDSYVLFAVEVDCIGSTAKVVSVSASGVTIEEEHAEKNTVLMHTMLGNYLYVKPTNELSIDVPALALLVRSVKAVWSGTKVVGSMPMYLFSNADGTLGAASWNTDRYRDSDSFEYSNNIQAGATFIGGYHVPLIANICAAFTKMGIIDTSLYKKDNAVYGDPLYIMSGPCRAMLMPLLLDDSCMARINDLVKAVDKIAGRVVAVDAPKGVTFDSFECDVDEESE